MSQTKTVSISGETKIEFDAVYPYVWVRNLGNSALTVWGDVGDTVSLSKLEAVRVITNTDYIYVSGTGSVEVIAQGIPDSPYKGCGGGSGGGGGDITVESLSVTDNGTYTAPSGKAYSPVSVDVQPTLGTKSVTTNGTYTASSDNLDGYSSVTVDVPSDIQQINPFDSGASTISLYNSNGVVVNSSSINTDGTGALNISESSAGYEGMVIELNVTAGHTYAVTFDYQNIDASYMAGFVIGWLLENSARTNYDAYRNWEANLPLDGTKTHEVASITATGSKIYMNFNLCGYSDSHTNIIDITNLKVYDISLPQE